MCRLDLMFCVGCVGWDLVIWVGTSSFSLYLVFCVSLSKSYVASWDLVILVGLSIFGWMGLSHIGRT